MPASRTSVDGTLRSLDAETRMPVDSEVLRARLAPREVVDLVHLARFLDNSFTLPGVGVKFGIDALIGLIPGIGDAASALISLYIVERAKRLGAPERLLNKMRVNIVIDTVIGAFPLFGDLFDVGFKASVRNVRLLLDHLGVDADLGDRHLVRRD